MVQESKSSAKDSTNESSSTDIQVTSITEKSGKSWFLTSVLQMNFCILNRRETIYFEASDVMVN